MCTCAAQVVSELVSSGNDLLEVDLALGGEHLSPTDFHERLKVGREAGDVVVVDVRNTYEARCAVTGRWRLCVVCVGLCVAQLHAPRTLRQAL